MTQKPGRSWHRTSKGAGWAKRWFTGALLLGTTGVAAALFAGSTHGSERIVADPAKLAARPERLVVGVGTHFALGADYNYQIPESARLIADIGFDSFRDDLDWPAFQALKGQFPGRLGEFMVATNATPLLILTAGNRLIPGTRPPITPAGRAAYAKFAGEVAASPQAARMYLELGNEWNLTAARERPPFADAGAPDDPRAAHFYAALVKAAIGEIQRARPTAMTLSGAAAIDPDWEWISAVAKDLRGAPTAISVHYYNQCKPHSDRNAHEAIGQLDRLQARLAAESNGHTTDIYLTEIGWPTATSCRVTREQSGSYMAQTLLWGMVTPWLRGIWLYQLKDQGLNPADIEDNFGIFDYHYRPKPAACLVKASIGLIRQMEKGRVVRRTEQVTVVDYLGKGGRKLIAWANKPDGTATLSIPGQDKLTSQPLCASGGTARTAALTNVPTVIALPSPSAPVTVEVQY